MKKLPIYLFVCLASMLFISTSCNDKLKKLENSKWTLASITTSHGQELIPNEFLTVFIKGDELVVGLEVNVCRMPFKIIDKQKINISDAATCTRMCCDGQMSQTFLSKLQGDFTVHIEDDRLVLKGKDTLAFTKWKESDVNRKADEDYIKIKRTGCFGTCPIYEMTVYADGTANYTGKRFVEVTGKKTHEFNPERIKKLLRHAERIDFKSLQAVYDNPSISDMESIFIEHNGTTVKVRFQEDVPKALLDFIDKVHQLSIDAGYVKAQ